MREEAIAKALEACYDAVIMPHLWPAAMQQFADAVAAACTVLYPVNPDTSADCPLDQSRPLKQMPMSPDYAGLIDEYLREQWYLNHYRAIRGRPLLESGRHVVIEHDLSTEDERKTLLHYNELYLRHGFPGFAMLGFRVGGQLWTLPMLRGTAQGHFTPQDAKRLGKLSADFARMVRLSENLAIRQAEGQLNMLQKLGSAAIVLDWQGLVLDVNAQASALLGTDLILTHRRLRAADPRSNLDLQLLLDQLRALPAIGAGTVLSRVSVRRRDSGPLMIEALPVSGISASVFQRAKVLLVLTDLERRSQPPEEMLRKAFDLTGAEARLARLLAGGDNLKVAAEHLRITTGTARVHLKSIFAKTGTNRQAELVARLGNMRGS